jgi:selenocysteine lyase/cysteine desulfurase
MFISFGQLLPSAQHTNGYSAIMGCEHHDRLGADQASSTVGYTDEFMEGARRYDFGERSNFILLPMMSAALNQVLEWRPDNIQRTIAPLIADINRRGQALELRAPEQGVDHLTGLRVRTGRFSHELQKSLSDAHVHVSLRGKALRISPYLYNSSADVDRLFEVLERALRR